MALNCGAMASRSQVQKQSGFKVLFWKMILFAKTDSGRTERQSENAAVSRQTKEAIDRWMGTKNSVSAGIGGALASGVVGYGTAPVSHFPPANNYVPRDARNKLEQKLIGRGNFRSAVFSIPFDSVKTQLQRMQPDANGVMPYSGRTHAPDATSPDWVLKAWIDWSALEIMTGRSF
jgi:hypothetical protein